MNHSPKRRVLRLVLAACLGMSLLAGCSAAQDLDGELARDLQTRVAAAKQLTAQQDFPGALAELQGLGQDVSAAAEQGRMSGQRKARIEAAISTIKADLEAAMTPAPQPAPTGPAVDPPDDKDAKEREEDAKKEAEEQREEKQKEAEKEKDQEQDRR
jgi:hypothetical protein